MDCGRRPRDGDASKQADDGEASPNVSRRYNGLAAGLLTGKHAAGGAVAAGRFKDNPNYLSRSARAVPSGRRRNGTGTRQLARYFVPRPRPRFYTDDNFRAVDAIRAACDASGVTMIDATSARPGGQPRSSGPDASLRADVTNPSERTLQKLIEDPRPRRAAAASSPRRPPPEAPTGESCPLGKGPRALDGRALRSSPRRVLCRYAWLLNHSALGATDGVLLGASSLDQLDANLNACAGGGAALPRNVVDAMDGAWDLTRPGAFKYWRSFSADFPGREDRDPGASYAAAKART